MPAATAPIAVVVLSFGPRASLPKAVSSILEQDVPAEVLVVHSGPGDAGRLLTEAGLPHVPVLSVPDRLYAGGARNLGVSRTTAPIVAFLADDHQAAPGWLKARLAAHAAGYRAVACALIPQRPYNPVALCWHYATHRGRFPGAPDRIVSHHGVSYERELLSRVGTFREDRESGEDTELNARVAAATPILFSSDVVTKHDSPTTLRAALRDIRWRARRNAADSAAPWQPRLQPRAFRIPAVGSVIDTARQLGPRQRFIFILASPLAVGLAATNRWLTQQEYRKSARTSDVPGSDTRC